MLFYSCRRLGHLSKEFPSRDPISFVVRLLEMKFWIALE
jgi:hypothetical protein